MTSRWPGGWWRPARSRRRGGQPRDTEAEPEPLGQVVGVDSLGGGDGLDASHQRWKPSLRLPCAVEVLAADDADQDLDPAAAALSKSRQWLLTALRAGGDMQTVKQLGDRLAQAGHPLKPRTIQLALGELEVVGLAAGSQEGNGRARYWSPAIANPDADNAGDDQAGDGGGEGMA
jgi:hypothetical protein